MPRYARIKSNSQVYHIMLRGIDRMPIFFHDEDRIKFLDTIATMKKEGEYKIYAYCLIDNHVHLLMKEEKDTIQRSLKRIGVSYAYFFNKKYDRVGHVFQDRFRSENVEDDRYLLAAARYIHNNPVKDGLVKNIVDYPWSSYHEYLNPVKNPKRVDTEMLLRIFSENQADAISLFKLYTNQAVGEEFIDIDNKLEGEKDPLYISTPSLEQLVKSLGYEYITDLKRLNRTKRNHALKELKENSAMSIRELSRALGISKDIIFRA